MSLHAGTASADGLCFSSPASTSTDKKCSSRPRKPGWHRRNSRATSPRNSKRSGKSSALLTMAGPRRRILVTSLRCRMSCSNCMTKATSTKRGTAGTTACGRSNFLPTRNAMRRASSDPNGARWSSSRRKTGIFASPNTGRGSRSTSRRTRTSSSPRSAATSWPMRWPRKRATSASHGQNRGWVGASSFPSTATS